VTPSAAGSGGPADEVRAVTVVPVDDQDPGNAGRIHDAWNAWQPHVPLTVLTSQSRSLTRPIVDYPHTLEAAGGHDRLVVLIPEMHLPRPWQRLLQNQRGAILDRALRRHTDAVICRLRFRVDVPR